MNIACIGWGSLVWDTRDLPIRSEWFLDGPQLRVEFARQSNDGRLTLVISDDANAVSTLWARMAHESLPQAIQALAARENIPANRANQLIGSTDETSAPDNSSLAVIRSWCFERGLDAAVWTALPPRFNGVPRIPSEGEALEYLRSLSGEKSLRAEEYIRKTPAQIITALRGRFEEDLGWTPFGI